MTSSSPLQTSPESAQPDQGSVRTHRPLKPTGSSSRRCSSIPTWREKITTKFRNNLAATNLPEIYIRQCEVAEGRYEIIKAAAQIHCQMNLDDKMVECFYKQHAWKLRAWKRAFRDIDKIDASEDDSDGRQADISVIREKYMYIIESK